MVATVAAGSLAPVRNLDRSLGDGGMPLLAQLGVSFERYGEGWAEAAWQPTELAATCSHRARRRVRRGPRRGHELRRQQ
jgi:hypothetical protein